MGEIDQNRWAECAKIDQNERNEMGWRELGDQNDPTGPKWIFKMSAKKEQTKSAKSLLLTFI